AAELRTLLIGGVWPRVVLASAAAAAGHVAVFVVAARSVGVSAPLPQLVALAFVVLLASALPLNVAGWGPREGATAWLFAGAGLGAATGVSVAVVYGVVSLVATLPGLVALVGPGRTRAPVTEVVASA
ncbi:lysylphosphatidylglycerol synthase domain-containing protein, partial [Nocardioides pelophilus]|uniref:lysylphosphatidylglycerol synthase domain-containing protein n=1 Tax=Nocardioides pelophilus TaxID=2172019 RepID=UPI001601F92E